MNLSTVLIEFANMLVVIMSGDTLSVIGNFVALVIIAEFDTYIYASLKDESLSNLINDEFLKRTLVINHTTSSLCGESEVTEVQDPEGDYRLRRVLFRERSLGNKAMFLVYRMQRLYFVSIYYFLPFMGVILAVIIPLWKNKAHPVCA